MVDYQLPLDWNILHSLANDATLRNYRKSLSRVTKPSSSSSAGSSPHSHSTSHATTYPRRRTMTTFDNGVTPMHPARNLFSISPLSSSSSSVQSRQRPPRPISWHPSVRAVAAAGAHQANYYVAPNCHPSWLRGDLSTTATPLEPVQQSSAISSMYGLSTPITCPVSGDLLSTNDYFGGSECASSYNNFVAPGPQVYTPVEPSDNTLYSDIPEWQPYSMESTPVSTYPWMQYNFNHNNNNNNGSISTDPAMIDFGGHGSVASTDDFTAPPTPEVFNYSQQPGTQYLQTVMSTTQDNLIVDDNHNHNDYGGGAGGGADVGGAGDDDDLVAVGLYDEPSMLSLSLLGGSDTNNYHSTGKGLKLEETFTPAEDHEDDAEAEDDD